MKSRFNITLISCSLMFLIISCTGSIKTYNQDPEQDGDIENTSDGDIEDTSDGDINIPPFDGDLSEDDTPTPDGDTVDGDTEQAVDGDVGPDGDDPIDGDSDEAVDGDEDEPADGDAGNCVCSTGSCCDGCSYYGTEHVCETEAAHEFGCPWGVACGDDIGVRHQDRYCSGSSSSCQGITGDWGAWEVAVTCSSTEYCSPGMTNCLYAESQSYFACYSGDLYWYDTCGILEEKKEDCGLFICSDGECKPSALSCTGGVCTDPSTSLEWQQVQTSVAMSWHSANNHCQYMSFDGGGWRLPNISELRSLFRNCASVGSGGACGVLDECVPCGVSSDDVCLDFSCYEQDDCNPTSCSNNGGETGCYHPEEISGACSYYWSVSTLADEADRAWRVNFMDGYVGSGLKTAESYVRCVR